MKFHRDSWVFVTGQANSGKTFFIKKHLEKIPQNKLFVYDFNGNDYEEFCEAYIWDVSEGSQEEIETFMKKVYKQGNCFSVFEEADNYFGYPSEFIRRYVNTARNRGIGAFVNAKRAKAIQPVYRNRFTHLVIFRTTIPEDITYLEKWSGAGKGEFEKLRTLSQGQYIECDLEHGDIKDIDML